MNSFEEEMIARLMEAETVKDIKSMVQHSLEHIDAVNGSGPELRHFVDRMISLLNLISPLNLEASEWQNIRTASVAYYRLKLQLAQAMS